MEREVDIDCGYEVVVAWSGFFCFLMFRYPVLYTYRYELMNLLDMQVSSSTLMMDKENNISSFYLTVLKCSCVSRTLVDVVVSSYSVSQIG